MDFDFDKQIAFAINALTGTSQVSYALQGYTFGHNVYGYSKGKKYARVYYDMSNGQRMVAFFVDIATGDIWKADGWKKPALNFVRGHIRDAEGIRAITVDKMGPTGYFYGAF